MATGTLAVDEWAVTFGTASKGLGGLRRRPGPPRCTKCNSPPTNCQCTNFDVALQIPVPIKGLTFAPSSKLVLLPVNYCSAFARLTWWSWPVVCLDVLPFRTTCPDGTEEQTDNNIITYLRTPLFPRRSHSDITSSQFTRCSHKPSILSLLSTRSKCTRRKKKIK